MLLVTVTGKRGGCRAHIPLCNQLHGYIANNHQQLFEHIYLTRVPLYWGKATTLKTNHYQELCKLLSFKLCWQDQMNIIQIKKLAIIVIKFQMAITEKNVNLMSRICHNCNVCKKQTKNIWAFTVSTSETFILKYELQMGQLCSQDIYTPMLIPIYNQLASYSIYLENIMTYFSICCLATSYH